MTGEKDEPFASGAAEAARLVREVQDLGFEAARTIVERFTEIFSQFAGMDGGTRPLRDGGRSTSGSWGFDRSAQTLASDMQRAADSYLAIMGQLNEAGMRFLDASRWFQQTPGAQQKELRLPDVAPGGRVSARLWLHNTTASTATDLRPWCPGLVSHSGPSLPTTTVTCAPERIDRLDPDASREVLITVTVGEDASSGAYHGQLLVDGLPDVVFPIRAQVLATSKQS